MRHRWTMSELTPISGKTDREILIGLVLERKSDVTNIYTPFAQRLDVILRTLSEKKSLELTGGGLWKERVMRSR